MDFSVLDGRPALNRGRSKALVSIDNCWLLEPALADLVARLGPLHGVQRLTVRVGAATGDAFVVLTGRIPAQAADWGAAVVRRHRDGYEAVAGNPWITEVVAGRRFRISTDAFFQNSSAGAAALVESVMEAAELRPDDVVLDGYAGGGLFTAFMAETATRVIAVESHPVAADDLRHNTGELGNVEAVQQRVERLDRVGWTVAVVDPPRSGLGRAGVEAVTRAMPRTVVSVSCDPASLARDARILTDSGYDLDGPHRSTCSPRRSTSRR